jgi:hypothetical protein
MAAMAGERMRIILNSALSSALRRGLSFFTFIQA